MKEICKKDDCTGCWACFNSCPQSSIEMKMDEYGFYFPIIDETRCINCNLCKKICPSITLQPLRYPKKALAAISKNAYDYRTATSGGIATSLTKKILSENGVVYGAVMGENLEVYHERITLLDETEKLKGSKYVQSLIKDCFLSVKKDLFNGKRVLFIGTPCQCAGLRSFLRRDYKFLYVCDIICHGVPSIKMLNDHVRDVVGEREVNKITFRDKEGYCLSIFNCGKCEYKRKGFLDLFCLGFLKGLFFRESCYACKYATGKRIGDLTLGDFWGFDYKKERFPVEIRHGLSLILVNTEQGEALLSECADDLILMQRDIGEAIDGNHQLNAPSSKHKNHDKFMKLYSKYGFKKAADKTLFVEKIKHWLLVKLGY
ncbi:Coenzyme F420 hydrogenase/dehydrogenase, beta subunit C-terminal domain [Mediterraneibacter sp.]